MNKSITQSYIYQINNTSPGKEDIFTRNLVSKIDQLTETDDKLIFIVDEEKMEKWNSIDLSQIFGYETAFSLDKIDLRYFIINTIEFEYQSDSNKINAIAYITSI